MAAHAGGVIVLVLMLCCFTVGIVRLVGLSCLSAFVLVGRTIYSYRLLGPVTRQLRASLRDKDVRLPVFIEPRCIHISIGRTNLITVSCCTEEESARPDGTLYTRRATHPVWALVVPKRLIDPDTFMESEPAWPEFFENEEAVVNAAVEAAIRVAADPKLMAWEQFDAKKAAAQLGISHRGL
jgi:hypothetical protein